MRRIVLWVMSTVTIVVLLFGYHTSTSSSMAATGVVSATPAPGKATAPKSGGSGASSSEQTITGPVAQTQWGPMQVQITVNGSQITDVQVLQHPTGNGTSDQINAYALPTLQQETMQAQSAHIDMVSGATVSSTGYIQSLQAALDQAGM